MNLIWLNGVIGTGAGDVAGGAEFRPTDAAVAVLETIEKDLTAAKTAYEALLQTDIPAANKALTARGASPIAIGDGTR